MRVSLRFIIARAARPMVLLAWYPRVLECPGLGERSSSSLLSLKEPRELALASEVVESGLGALSSSADSSIPVLASHLRLGIQKT